jgi:GMP synthase (glutamine-hydrolysing)
MIEKVLVIDFGSQFTQLIARRIREQNVYCEIQPYHNAITLDAQLKGVILSGGPSSVYASEAPDIDLDALLGNIPVLGICYGAQLLAHKKGGKVENSATREYGRAHLNVHRASVLFEDVPTDSQVWMSHGDSITQLPDGFELVAGTESIATAAFQDLSRNAFALQFHPEVTHSEHGGTILRNFLYKICGMSGDWTPAHFVESSVAELKAKIGGHKVVCGLSGGVDSTVAAVLIDRAIGDDLYCIFVDNGLLRKHEYEEVLEKYKTLGLNVKGVDASARFINELTGVSDPETKRKIIGRVFVEVFQEEAKAIPGVEFLAQGTIYPDVIESVSVKGPSATIKSHHNVGGLPASLHLGVVEPLRFLFKDEVRKVGLDLGLEQQFIGRHPFPGPGLAIRVISDITEAKLNVLKEVDHIFISELRRHGLYDQVWQAFAVLLPVSSVGVMGDERTYENVVALRTVTSVDGMTADWGRLPYDFLAEVSNKIINTVKGVNRVVYDISSKPPATIEWE